MVQSADDPSNFKTRGEQQIGKLTGVIVVSGALRQQRNQRKKKSAAARSPTLEKHISHQKRHLLTYEMKKACELQTDGTITFAKVDELDAISSIVPYLFQPNCTFRKGWAVRPPVGKMYGAKYIHRYRKDVEEFYRLEERDEKD